MKRNTLFSALALLMILGATVLFAQEIREEEEWGEYWGLFPVKPGEVFSNPERYWFYDNVDLSDTLKWVINYSDSVAFEHVYVSVAYGFWCDPYRNSYCETYHVYDSTYAHSDLHYAVLDEDERGRGYCYVVMYRKIYNAEHQLTDIHWITSEAAIRRSERFSLLERHVSDQNWYDIDLEEVSFYEGRFEYDLETGLVTPESVIPKFSNGGDIPIQSLYIGFKYKHDGVPDEYAIRDTTHRSNIAADTTMTIRMRVPITMPLDSGTINTGGTLDIALIPYWDPPMFIFEPDLYVPIEHRFVYYHENEDNNTMSLDIEWYSGTVLYNKNIVIEPGLPNFGSDQLTGLNLTGDENNNVIYLPANEYVTVGYKFTNKSVYPLSSLQYRFVVEKRALFTEGSGNIEDNNHWEPLEYADHYYCSPAVDDSTHWRNAPTIHPNQSVDLKLNMQKFRHIYNWGEDYRRNPIHDPSNWRIQLIYRYKDINDYETVIDTMKKQEVYFLEEEKREYYGFPVTYEYLDFSSPYEYDLWNNGNVVVNATLGEMRSKNVGSANLIPTNELRFHRGIDLKTLMSSRDQVNVFTISSGKISYVSNGSNSGVISYDKSIAGRRQFYYIHCYDLQAAPHLSIFNNRLVNSGFPVAQVYSSKAHLHLTEYSDTGGLINPLREEGIGISLQKPVDGRSPVIFDAFICNNWTRERAYASIKGTPSVDLQAPLVSVSSGSGQVLDFQSVNTAGLDIIAEAGDYIGVPSQYQNSINNGLMGVYCIGYKLERINSNEFVLANEIGKYRWHWEFDTVTDDNSKAKYLFSAKSHFAGNNVDPHVYQYILTNRKTGESSIPKHKFVDGTYRLTVRTEDIEGNSDEEVIEFSVTNAGTIPDSVISTHETWSGVVHIPYDVHITQEGSVSVLPGTVIVFYDQTRMQIDGGFSANLNGSGDLPTICPMNPDNGSCSISVSSSASADFEDFTIKDIHIYRDNNRDEIVGIINITDNDNVSFENCRFINCSSDLGGVIYCDNSDISITNCEFKCNTAQSGGAIYIENSDPTLIGNLFWNNSADNGSAIYATGSNPVIVNNTFRHTLYEIGQSVIYLANSSPDIYNTIIYNEVDSPANCSIHLSGSSQPDFWNCAIFNGQATFIGQPFLGTYQNIIESDPQFVDNYQVGYIIENNSPCVNTGQYPVPGITLPLNDLAGGTRIDESVVDIGAYETQQSSGDIHVSGDITEDTCWSSDVVYIDDDVSVLENVSLTVLPDVDIVLAASCDFEIIGSIHIYGSENEPVNIYCPVNSITGATLTISDPYSSLNTLRNVNQSRRQDGITRDEESATCFSHCLFNSVGGGLNGEGVKVVVASQEEVIFEHCSFRNAGPESNGGCLEIINSSPIIRDCEFTSGNAVSGGAIYAINSNFMLLASILHDNNATNGGAIYLDEYCSPFIANCTIVDNTADYGGALFCYEDTATPIVVNSILYSNTATEGAQGYFYNYGGVGQGPDDDPTGFFYCNIQGGIDSLYVYLSETRRGASKLRAGSSTRSSRNGLYNGSYESNIDCDPSFIANSFELRNTSLCINRGTLEDWSIVYDIHINNDLIGYPPTDNLYDIGAIEKVHYGSISIGGVISEDCFLLADTIYVSTNLTIAQDVTVLVDTLVSYIQFGDDVSVLIQGSLEIAGTENDSLQLCAINGSTNWKGMNVGSTGSLKLAFARMTDSAASTGGVISTSEGCIVTISNCEFNDNQATSGGALHVNGGEIRINNTLFCNNVANNGGAIYHVDSDTLDIGQCVFSGNIAEGTGNGGAIFSSSSVRMTNNLFHDNIAVNGGAIYQEDGDIICLNATIMGNQASLNGGGIAFNRDAEALRFALLNSIIRGNHDSNEGPSQFSALVGNHIHIAYCNIENMMDEIYDNHTFEGVATAVCDYNPGLKDIESGDYTLAHFSPCIDAGAPTPHYLFSHEYSLFDNDFGHEPSGMHFDQGFCEFTDPAGCEVKPGGLHFEDTYMGRSSSVCFTIRNRGTEPLIRINGIETPSDYFTVSVDTTSSTGAPIRNQLRRKEERTKKTRQYVRNSRRSNQLARKEMSRRNPEMPFVSKKKDTDFNNQSRAEKATRTRSFSPIELSPFKEVTIRVDFAPMLEGTFNDPMCISIESSIGRDVILPVYATSLDPTVHIDSVVTWTDSLYIDYPVVVDITGTLNISNNTEITFAGFGKIVCNGGTFNPGTGVSFIGEPDNSEDGVYLNICSQISFLSSEFVDTRLISHSTAVQIASSYFTDCYIEHCNKDLTIEQSQFSGTNVNAFRSVFGGMGSQNDCIHIELSDFNFSEYTNLVSISSYPNFEMNENNFSNYQTALWINESGFGKLHDIVDNTIFNNEYGYGIEIYHSTATITGHNVINNNYIGVAAVRNSDVTINGSCYYPYQSIHNNFNAELVFANDSFPILFSKNLIYDQLYGDNHLVRCVHHNADTLVVEDNFWGAFTPTEHLSPYEYYDYNPQWIPGDSVFVDYDPALELFSSAEYNMTLTNYLLAETQYKQVVSDYPRTRYARTSAIKLISLEGLTGGDYTDLQLYYLNEPNLHYDEQDSLLAIYLYNLCMIKTGNYPAAISWFETIIDDPRSEADSIYAVIDIGYTYLLMESDSRYRGYVGRYPQYKPRSFDDYLSNRETLLKDMLDQTTEAVPELPVYVVLEQNHPNPFNPETTISYSIPAEGQVSLTVYNIKGQKVITLVNEIQEKGKQSVIWKGVNSYGKSVSSGVYLYKLDACGKSITRKMLMLK